MKKRSLLLLLLLCTLTGAVSAEDAVTAVARNPVLAPCSRYSDASTALGFTVINFDAWATSYHETVAKVVEEHLQSMQTAAECGATDDASFMRAGPELETLARKLPTWKNGLSLSMIDMGPVLLEYLRTYECAMKERTYFRALDAQKLQKDKATRKQSGDNSEEVMLTLGQIGQEMDRELTIINRELTIARPLLTRTLTVLSGMDRLLPFDAPLQCMERASLDIRNAVGLAAETATCLPRVWSNDDPLRDLAP